MKQIISVIGGVASSVVGLFGSIASFVQHNYFLAGVFIVLLVIGLILLGLAFGLD